MAHILKFPSTENKGIILFTHKEVNFFSMGLKETRFTALNKFHRSIIPFTRVKPYFKRHLDKLSKHYMMGMHFGWYHRNYPTIPYMDFYLATESTVTFEEEEKIFRIPLSSSSFINEAYENKNYQNKIWDIVSVSHNGNNKRLKDFLLSIRKLYDSNKKYKVLLVNKEGANEIADKNYVDIDKDYNNMFSIEEKNLFTLLRISNKLSFLGLPPAAISDFYNLSKVFALFSEQEGEPRAVSEALICGLPVVMNRNIKAGGVGLDLLNNENSVLFEDYDQAHLALIKAVEHFDQFNINSEKVKGMLREDYTIKILKEYLVKLYRLKEQSFDGHLDNAKFLANAVNAHITQVPWGRGHQISADVLSKGQFNIFYKECVNQI